MGKSYYCEFCDKSFADNPSSRRNHLRGVTHRQLKKQHYESFKDAATILRENQGKNPCRAFLNDGQCTYNHCMYSHLTPEMKTRLEQQVNEEQMKKQRKEEQQKLEADVKLEDWLRKYNEKQKEKLGSSSQEFAYQSVTMSDEMYKLPECLENRVNLPPSLLPPKVGEVFDCTTEGWG